MNRLRSLSIVLEDAEVAISVNELGPQEKANLKDVLDNCQRTLSRLEHTIDKYSELGSRQTNISSKLKEHGSDYLLSPRTSATFGVILILILPCSLQLLGGSQEMTLLN
jgi:hypothetical protein